MSNLIRINVGGCEFTTRESVIRGEGCREPKSIFNDQTGTTDLITADSSSTNGRVLFIDRDGQLFRPILNYLRTGFIHIPSTPNVPDINIIHQLREEAEFYQMSRLSNALSLDSYQLRSSMGNITVSYRGTFAFGRDGQADVKFRKLNRILVCGRIDLNRKVFGETLNESRDPDGEGNERYTARLFLKHNSIENAFDCLTLAGYKMTGSCSSGASGAMTADGSRPSDSEELRWNHYNEFVFTKIPFKITP